MIRAKESVLKMRFEEIYGKYIGKRLSGYEAAELLGMSERTFRRKKERYQEEGMEGLNDRRLHKRSAKRAGDREVAMITQLYAQRYRGFSVKHFHEFAKAEHGLKYGYTWTKKTLENARLITKSKRGGDHRLRRERRPLAGMMLHQDASQHRWIEGHEDIWDLVVTMDDATSVITSAFFCCEEGTASTFRGLEETITVYGLFCSLYTDRGTHYWTTPQAGGKVDKINLTQVGRALKELKIKHIAAYSPQARGRSERMFGTLQGRLPMELKLKGITTMDEANTYLKEHYIPKHNAQFSVAPKQPESAYIPWVGPGLEEILCIHEERQVASDNTVRYNGLVLQIPQDDMRHHYVKTVVDVRDYGPQGLGVFYGHRCIGRYTAQGVSIDTRGGPTQKPVVTPQKNIGLRDFVYNSHELPTSSPGSTAKMNNNVEKSGQLMC